MSKIHLCTKCKIEPSKRSEGKGTSSWCQKCSNVYEKSRWKNMSKEKRRNIALMKNRNLTLKDLQNLFEKQNGKCITCNKQLKLLHKNVNSHDIACIDHCHTTGNIRGLLCNHCNRALGLLKEDINTMKNLITYLEVNNR